MVYIEFEQESVTNFNYKNINSYKILNKNITFFNYFVNFKIKYF